MKPLVIVAVCFLLLGNKASAATLEIVTWRGQDALLLSGPIDASTARQFNELIPRVKPAAHGLPIMLLDSLGGSVMGALKLSAAMRNAPVHTVVPKGAKCASACASLVFIGGRYRTVEPFGAFGQHSCSVNGVQDQECNELISQHAINNGVSHGSVSAFTTYVPPEDILWFSREDVDGWGISRYPGTEASGFKKSEPRVFKLITGEYPPAQPAWRLDFWQNGWRAFYRPAGDDERELQINQFCSEDIPGTLILGMEIHGEKAVLQSAVQNVELISDKFDLNYEKPYFLQVDPAVSMVLVTIPTEYVLTWLQEVDDFQFLINTTADYEPIVGWGKLRGSRENLIFAANHCIY